jgi:hypothetical protein
MGGSGGGGSGMAGSGVAGQGMAGSGGLAGSGLAGNGQGIGPAGGGTPGMGGGGAGMPSTAIAALMQAAMAQPQQKGLTPLDLQQPPRMGGDEALRALEGRYVAPTGAGYQYYQGGSIAPPFNPLMLQQMLQQRIAQQQPTGPNNLQRVLGMQPRPYQFLKRP